MREAKRFNKVSIFMKVRHFPTFAVSQSACVRAKSSLTVSRLYEQQSARLILHRRSKCATGSTVRISRYTLELNFSLPSVRFCFVTFSLFNFRALSNSLERLFLRSYVSVCIMRTFRTIILTLILFITTLFHHIHT